MELKWNQQIHKSQIKVAFQSFPLQKIAISFEVHCKQALVTLTSNYLLAEASIVVVSPGVPADVVYTPAACKAAYCP